MTWDKLDGNMIAADAHYSEGEGQFGTEEGETCNRLGCDGVMIFDDVENCSCHISAPCAGHMRQQLICGICGSAQCDDEMPERHFSTNIGE